MTSTNALAPGQQLSSVFPRFGLPALATRIARDLEDISITLGGEVETSFTLGGHFKTLARVEQVSDFNCVTTWCYPSINWGGYRFSDVYNTLILPLAKPVDSATVVVFRGQDGYYSSLPLELLLADEVLLADSIDGASLGVEHGAPIRLVAPAHYGYKNVKHIKSIEFYSEQNKPRAYGLPLMDHPTARIANEERARLLPAKLARLLYRPLIKPTTALFKWGMNRGA